MAETAPSFVRLTGPQPAGVAVFRLWCAPELVKGFVGGKAVPAVTHLTYCKFFEDSDRAIVLDDILLVCVAPQVFELHFHGGRYITDRAKQILETRGFREVDHGFQSDFERALPLARTRLAMKVLLAQPANWAAREPDRTNKALYRLLHPPVVALLGVPNVGKSSLANRLFIEHRSITADLPGTTRDWVGAEAMLEGLVVKLADTPGLRDSADPIERMAIEQAGPVVSGADLQVLVLAADRDLEPQLDLIDRFPSAMLVANKSDLSASEFGVKRFHEAALGRPIHRVSAVSGRGVDSMRVAVRNLLLHTDDPEALAGQSLGYFAGHFR